MINWWKFTGALTSGTSRCEADVSFSGTVWTGPETHNAEQSHKLICRVRICSEQICCVCSSDGWWT